MSDTLEYQPSERDLALSSHARRKAFHRSIEAKAEALRAPPIVCPARTWEDVAPPVVELPGMTAPEFYKECWFQILSVSPPPRLSLAQIKNAVCQHYGVTAAEMISARRQLFIIRPRQVAMYLCRQLTLLSMPVIGNAFGGRDHTTILHASRRVPFFMANDKKFAEEVAGIRAHLESLL